jgi:hypothetical protein
MAELSLHQHGKVSIGSLLLSVSYLFGEGV